MRCAQLRCAELHCDDDRVVRNTCSSCPQRLEIDGAVWRIDGKSGGVLQLLGYSHTIHRELFDVQIFDVRIDLHGQTSLPIL